MKEIKIIVGLLILVSVSFSPAFAEGITWNFSSYAKLGDALMQPEPIVYTEDKAPVYVLTRFVVEGNSAVDWTESLELLNTNRKNHPKKIEEWYETFKAQGDQNCPSQWQLIAEEKNSLTFERITTGCDGWEDQQALYRVIYGKRDVFTLIATRKGTMDAETREGWLQLLASASLKR